MQKKFKKEIASLTEVFRFIEAFMTQHAIDESAAFSINFAIEEIFTNMVKYGTVSSHDILISLKKKNDDLLISLTDFDVLKFDVTKAAAVDVNQTLKERKIGGLGLHLTKRMVDEIRYEYKDKNSKITLIKHLET